MGMVDITDKPDNPRSAEAFGKLVLRRTTLERIQRGEVEKGDPLSAARIAGTIAAKKTWEILPFCHQIPLSSVKLELGVDEEGVWAKSSVKAIYKTGVEMEALICVTTALLTVWDMVKQYEKDEKGEYPQTKIKDVVVLSKKKGEHA